MNKPDLSVTRAQFAGNDGLLWTKESKPAYLTNPLTNGELWLKEILAQCTTGEEFMAALRADCALEKQRAHLLGQIRVDAARMKAEKGLTTAQVRDQKAMFIVRWMSRMELVLGMPKEWLKLWMKGLRMVNKKGKLVVEFGGDP